MISVDEARRTILNKVGKLASVELPIMEALGMVLDEDVLAEADIPPFDNSAMDGYAVRIADVADAGPDSFVELKVLGDLAAGYIPERAIGPGETIRIMTGAPMPDGADAVVMQEYTERNDNVVRVLRTPKPGEHVRPAGEDVHRGEIALFRGMRLTPACIGMLAGIGKTGVKVVRKPVVAVIATGDEVVELGEPLTPGKIRNSNSYSIAALVIELGCIPRMLGIAGDSQEDLIRKIEAGTGADLIVTIGGVSVGDYDLVKDALGAIGETISWKVKMKPGKPLVFGMINGVPLIGLPGNPTSAIVSFDRFARPALLKMSGRNDLSHMTIEAISEDLVKNKSGRNNFIRVTVRRDGCSFKARLSGAQNSGSLKPMTSANGLMVVPDDVHEVKPGERVTIELFELVTS